MSQLWNFAKASRFIDLAASRLIDRANMARDSKVYPEAAALYEQALAMIPDDAAIHIQCGHMFKETGVLPKAEEHYKRAYELTPDDADLALQMGHFYKISGRLRESETAYTRALKLVPDWSEPAVELEALYRKGYRSQFATRGVRGPEPTVSVGQPGGAVSPNFDDSATTFGLLGALEGLAPEAAPRHPRDMVPQPSRMHRPASLRTQRAHALGHDQHAARRRGAARLLHFCRADRRTAGGG